MDVVVEDVRGGLQGVSGKLSIRVMLEITVEQEHAQVGQRVAEEDVVFQAVETAGELGEALTRLLDGFQLLLA